MMWRLSVEMFCSPGVLRSPSLRYQLLDRWSRLSDRYGVRLAAFGWGVELRLLVEGSHESVMRWTKAWKVGFSRSVRARQERVDWGAVRSFEVREPDIPLAVGWAHRAPTEGEGIGVLASPWSSHRDLLGFRRALFFDASVLEGRVNAWRVHEEIQGAELSMVTPDLSRRPLAHLLRVAAAVLGVLPTNRRCFGLFVRLGRLAGWKVREIAEALILTERRVRQLAQGAPMAVGWVLPSLVHPCLSQVP